MTKKCFKCGKVKDIELFYKHKGMADGHLGKCIECTKKDVHQRYSNPESKKRIVEYERKRFNNPTRKENNLKYQIKRRLKSPGKWRCYKKVQNALRNGQLIKKPCEICGELKVQAHHKDYRKYLDVKWLCFKCHRKEHGQNPS